MTDTPTTEAAAPAEPLDVTGAAALLLKTEEKQEPEQPEPAEPEPAAAEEAPPEPETPQGEQPEEPAAAESEEAYDLEKIHGNTKIRLRDGSEWTAAELKRRIADLQDIERHRENFSQEITKFQQERSQTAQQAQLFAQVAPQAIAAIQASLPQVPPPPTPEIESADPFKAQEMWGAHLRAKADYEAKVNQMRQIQFAQQQQHAQAQAVQVQQLQQAVQTERQKLLEKHPEFADPEKAKDFQSNFVKYGKAYGFTDGELSQVYDSRMIGVMKDAIAWRQLQSQPKPKPNQPAKSNTQSAPVQQPGRRVSGQEVKVQQKQELLKRVRASGDMRDAAEAIAKLGL